MDPNQAEDARFTLYDLADKLRERRWLVRAYPMPRNRGDLVVQRIVVKEDFSRELAERLLEVLRDAVTYVGSAKRGTFPLATLTGMICKSAGNRGVRSPQGSSEARRVRIP
jgi:hypothetical protein